MRVIPTEKQREDLRCTLIAGGASMEDAARTRYDIPDDPASVVDTIMRPLGIVPQGPFHYLRLWRLDECAAIGFVALHNVRGGDAELFIYAWPGLLNRATIRALARWMFAALGLRRVTARVLETDDALRNYLTRLGFKQEGVLRDGSDTGRDVLIFGMLATECHWLACPYQDQGSWRIQ